MTVQASRRQRPLSKGVPREWRGMYNAGGASTYHKSPLLNNNWTFRICFPIHTPRLRRTPFERGRAVAVRLSLAKDTECVYKRHRGSVPFRKGCHDSGGVCIKLAEPAQITKVLFSIIYGHSTSVSRYIPPSSAVPLSKGDAQ